jgi:septal ring factor EnvC (AmiA/AmiB activator)
MLAMTFFMAAGLCSTSLLAQDTAALEARQAESRQEYERIAREITLSDEKLAALDAEIAAARKDQATLTAAMIQAAKTERKLSEEVDAIGTRIATLREQETGLRQSLLAKRDVLAEVLGALQRMGLNPPPALLVRPDDALSSVRSAILLGAVVPELRKETEIVLAELTELSRLVRSIEAERTRLAATVTEQKEEQARLTRLIEEKTRLQKAGEQQRAEESRRAEELATHAGSLQELIGSLEGEITSLRQAREERQRREAEIASLPVPDANRLGGGAQFKDLRGRLALPVSGRIARRFGGDDGNGATLQGDMVTTQSGAIVTAPVDGTILYAGPFRSYGQLLILDAGGGYHVVLSGLGRVNVSLGQSVLAGEPVGAMGETRVASVAALDNGDTAPKLYVEFRHDGKPVDPAPWWAASPSGRTKDDS